MKKVLIFHPAIAPYRISFFNDISKRFVCKIALYYKNLKSQRFDYEKIEKQFLFEPVYFEKSIKILKRTFYIGHLKWIKSLKPDIVIVGEYGLGLWISILYRFFFRCKYSICTICDDSRNMAEMAHGGRAVSRALAIRQIDGLILCNEEANTWYKDHYGKVNTFVFPIIQDEHVFCEDFHLVKPYVEKIIDQYSLIGKRVFIFVGRLAPEKNLEYLIDSFINAHEKNKENVLFLIGGDSDTDPGFRKRMEDKISKNAANAYIEFVGRKEGIELKAWYYTGQVLVLPSISEAFGAVVNEALLAGERVMVSQNAGAACLVNDDNGQIINIGEQYIDFSEMSRKIEVLEKACMHRKNNMPILYSELMNNFENWLNELRGESE